MLDVAAEESDAESLGDEVKPPQYEEWMLLYFKAFKAIQDDRYYGAMGGASHLSFIAIDRWAARYHISDADFDDFHALITAMDDEFVSWLGEEAKKKTPPKDTNKNGERQA